MPELDKVPSGVAREIIEHSPAIALRIAERDGRWETLFITDNISVHGYQAAEFLGGVLSWQDIVHPEDLPSLLRSRSEHEKNGLDRYAVQYRIQTRRGDAVWVNEDCAAVRGRHGERLFTDCVISDYTFAQVSIERERESLQQHAVLNEILQSLYAVDAEQSLHVLLDHAGKHLDVSRVLLFEDDEDHVACKAVYEWDNGGVASLIKHRPLTFNYQRDIPDIYEDLSLFGVRAIDANMDAQVPRVPYDKGVVAAAMFAVYMNGGERYGFLSFDERSARRIWHTDTLAFLANIARLVSTALQRKRTMEALARTQRMFETVLNSVNTHIYAVDPQTNRIVFANEVFKQEFMPFCEGRLCWELIGGKQLPMCTNCMEWTQRALSDGDDFPYFELYVPGTKEWMGVQCSLTRWIDGRIVRLVNAQKITEMKRQAEHIRQMAYCDHLTGLPNRYRCDTELKEAIDDALGRGEIGYVLFIDMDDFKIINDGYGHDYGDAMLIEFARFLSDGLPYRHSVFRFGGDEFVVLVPPVHAGQVEEIIAAILARARQPWTTLDKVFYCTVSIGVVQYPDGGCGVTETVKNADIAMYKAKKKGKNSFVFYSDGMKDGSMQRAEMERLLRDAIARGFEGFEVYYQPILDLKTGLVCGAEALVRWFDQAGRMIMPVQFIALSEYLGLIVPIGEFVLEEAAALCRDINEVMPRFVMSVNVSMRQLEQQDIFRRIENILTKAGVDMRNIVLEVTESIAADDQSRLLTIYNELRKKGLQLAMDDFGTGYSSLNNMREMPLDIVKIDRSFIRDVTKDPYAHSFIHLITSLVHSMGKTVTIEGVETQEQLNYCNKANADTVQGFLFHPPLTKAQLLALLPARAPKEAGDQ